MSLGRQITRVTAFAAAWRDAVPNPKQVKPTVIQFPINNVCNSGCQMCDIWKQKKGEEITPEQVRKTLSQPIFDKVTAIGFNGGEPTLRRDFKELVTAAIDSLPKLQWVSLITNAIIANRVKLCIDDLAEICTKKNVNLDVMVSVDGYGSVHDRVRGKVGNFQTANEVLDHILQHPGVKSRRIGCTVIRENVFDVENVLDWAKQKGVYARFRCGIPHQRLYTESKIEPFAFTEQERFHFCNFLDGLRESYETNPARNDFYLSLRNQLAYGMPRTAGCAWKNKGATLLSNGDFAYCAVSSPTIGNVHTDDPEQMYWKNGNILQQIQRDKCANCRHDYEGISNRKTLIKGLVKKIGEFSPTLGKIGWKGKSALSALVQVKESFAPESLPKAGSQTGQKRFLIVGWYGTETLGDKAILGGLLQALRVAHGNIPVDIASLEPYVTEYTKLQMKELSDTRVLSVSEAKANLQAGKYSNFVFGGGPLMSAIPQVVDLTKLALLAKEQGARVLIAGCGIGPLGQPRGDRAIHALLTLADKIVVRDEGSRDLATRLGVTSPIEVAVDPAFLWIESSRDKSLVKEPTILLALRDWPINEYARGVTDAVAVKENFDRQVGEFVKTLREIAPEYQIRPICMHRLAVGGDDLLYYQRVLKNFPDLLESIPRQHQAPLDDLRLFERASGIFAMRFHSVVFGLATEQAVLALDYTLGGKIAGVLRDNGFDEPLSIRDFNGRKAAAALVNRLKQGNHLKVEVYRAEQTYVELFR